MNEIFENLEARAAEDVREEGFAPDQVDICWQVDMRYQHQGYQLPVDCPVSVFSEADKPSLKSAFDEAHHRIYGASAPDEDAEVVTFRVVAEIAASPASNCRGSGAVKATPPRGSRRGRFTTSAVGPLRMRRSTIGQNYRQAMRSREPAVVQQFDSTTVIFGGMNCLVDPWVISSSIREQTHGLDPITTEVVLSRVRETTEGMAMRCFIPAIRRF